MPTSISDLFKVIGQNIDSLKTVKWGVPPLSYSIGVYIISINSNPNSNSNLFDKAPINNKILEEWLRKVDNIKVDNKRATIDSLYERLNSFWLPDENIIYIGQTENKKGLNARILQYYRTPLGDRKPHAGGHWIKTLENLNELYVHYLPIDNPKEIERKLLEAFITQVSETTKKKLYDGTLPIPFANLELEKGNRKKHNITKSKL